MFFAGHLKAPSTWESGTMISRMNRAPDSERSTCQPVHSPRFLGSISQIAAVLAIVLGSAVMAPRVGARSADSCGTGYHKQSDGQMSDNKTASMSGHTAKASFSGWIRYCTYERRLLDQRNRRVLIGIPTFLVSNATFSGANQVRVCLNFKVTANAKHINNGTSIGMSGIVPGAVKTTGPSSSTMTMETCSSVASVKTLQIKSPPTLTFTVPTCSVPCLADPEFTSVVVTAQATFTFYTSAAKTAQNKVFVLATDKDVPN